MPVSIGWWVISNVLKACFYILLFWCVKHANDLEWVDEAVKHGAVEYYLDSENSRQWRWKPRTPEKKI